VKKLPKDLDIFFPSTWSISLCIQTCAKLPRVGAAGLGDLVLVVGELEVEAAAVDVEGGAEKLVRHGGAFDVPAGAAAAPGRVPAGGGLVGGLPEDEVERVLLEGGDLDAGSAIMSSTERPRAGRSPA
jgi:hypothetical protein